MAKYLKLFNNHSGYTAFTQSEEFVKPNVSHCIQENEVHYNPLPNANGHAYVDLGLPSGTLWATMNVGANSETDYGLYFQWGDTSGYTAAQVGSGEGQKHFAWNDYTFGTNGNEETSTPTKYNQNDGLTTLQLSDDAARANWGGDWKMPTADMYRELNANTKNGFISGGSYTEYEYHSEDDGWSYPIDGFTPINLSSTNLSGISGFIYYDSDASSIINAINEKKYIFFPTAGECYDGIIDLMYEYGSYYTSSLDDTSDRCINSWYAYLNFNNMGVDSYHRSFGRNIRAVLNQ